MRIRVPSPGSAGESALGATGGGAGGERVGAGTQGGGSRHTGWREQAHRVAGAAAEPAVSCSSSCSARPRPPSQEAEEAPHL